MSQTVTMRLPEETAEWLKASACRVGRSVSEWGAALVEVRAQTFDTLKRKLPQLERHEVPVVSEAGPTR